MVSVVNLSSFIVYAECRYIKCYYDEWRYDWCQYTESHGTNRLVNFQKDYQ